MYLGVQLSPIWDKVGEAFEAHPEVVLGKVDATENELYVRPANRQRLLVPCPLTMLARQRVLVRSDLCGLSLNTLTARRPPLSGFRSTTCSGDLQISSYPTIKLFPAGEDAEVGCVVFPP